MKKYVYAVFAMTLASPAFATHWTYEGEAGPKNWAKIDPSFAKCAEGKEQSPIDLRWSKPANGRKITFSYQASPLKIIDNGHTIQVNFEKGNTMTLEGHTFELLQMHFHAGSEHTVSAKTFPLEAHFVHKDAEGKLAVVGVLFVPGKSNPMLDKIFLNLPKKTGEEMKVSSVKIDPAAFFPSIKSHYHYMGSLTTPPCSEGVNWNVFNTPVEASMEQIQKFTSVYSHNARPVQPLFERKPANY